MISKPSWILLSAYPIVQYGIIQWKVYSYMFATTLMIDYLWYAVFTASNTSLKYLAIQCKGPKSE